MRAALRSPPADEHVGLSLAASPLCPRALSLALALALALALLPTPTASSPCASLSFCSGHGTCSASTSSCACDAGWGAPADLSTSPAADCSLRSCPLGAAWADIPSSPVAAHAPAECSGAGLCDRATGVCACFAGFAGAACGRSACPGSPPCSGRGRCLPLSALSLEPTAAPFGPALETPYAGWEGAAAHACACDSAWPVGYGAGQSQAGSWAGADCATAACDSADDPATPGVDETDCEWADANGAVYRGYVGADGRRYASPGDVPPGVAIVSSPLPDARKADADGAAAGGPPNAGAAGNRCHVPCARRGVCDGASGECACHEGYGGEACGRVVGVAAARRRV